MQLASGTIRLTPLNEVHKPSLTPAEVYILRAIHGHNAGGDAVINLVVHKEKILTKKGRKQVLVETDNDYDYKPRPGQEQRRLRSKYGKEPVQGGVYWFDKFYPGANPQLPETFAEVAYQAPEQVPSGEAATRDTLPGEPGHGDTSANYIPPTESKPFEGPEELTPEEEAALANA